MNHKVESGFFPRIKPFLSNLAAILGASILFALSFPNLLFSFGLPFLAWIAYVPVFWVIRRSTAVSLIFWGALYGYVSYSLFAPWLGVFHLLGAVAASLLQLCYMAILFPLLRLAVVLYPKKGYLLQWFLWLAYEYLRTLGFLGFPYGITGYTQWEFPALIGIASVFGVWGVSALVLFPSMYLGAGFSQGTFFRRERLAAAAWLGALAASLVFGSINPDYTKESPGQVKIVLIQQNDDPWEDENYRNTLRTLSALSQRALEAEPDTALVVWPETAFIPRIYWHLTYRDNADSYTVVRELMDFLESQRVPFLIGNDDARLEVNNTGRWDRVDYNAALYFERGALKQIYRKMHLVPFAEYFPYEKVFPRLYRILSASDAHFWKPGKEPVVFEAEFSDAAYLEGGPPGGHGGPAEGFRFSALVCFEDCFGSISRDFTLRGAELLVNLTNDAWSGSLYCQVQHLSMAVFRAVENRRSLVRAATSGQTCAIDPSGKILAMAEPFTETFLNTEVPLMKGRTPYTIWGDLWALLFLAAAVILLLIGMGRYIISVYDRKTQ